MKDLTDKKIILLDKKEAEMVRAFVLEILDGEYSTSTKQTATNLLKKLMK